MHPGLNNSLGLCGGDDVRSCLLDYAETVEIQLTDDRRLSCTWRSGDDEPFHVVLLLIELCPAPEIRSESRLTRGSPLPASGRYYLMW